MSRSGKRIRRAGAGAVALLAAAATPSLGADRNVELGFDFYGAGMHFASMRTNSIVNDREYKINSRIKTEGMVHWFADMVLKSRAEGSLNGSGGVPDWFESVSGGRWKGRSVALDFQPDGDVLAKIIPPPDNEEDKVPDAARRGALDPLSASVLNVLFKNPAEVCRQRIPIYDGRRRFDLIFTNPEKVELAKTRFSAFHGPAQKCELTVERIAGFRKKKDEDSKPPRPMQIWIARFEKDGLTLPVRLKADTNWGSLTAHLARIKIRDLPPAKAD